MGFESNAVTNGISVLSLLVSSAVGLLYLRDRRHAKFAIESGYIDSLLAWHGEVVEVLVRLNHSMSDRPAARVPDLARLSALIERGRFFFPNVERGDEYGLEKPPAYRGYRNLALDFLVAAYNIHAGSNPSAHESQATELCRFFTSIVFEIVRPADRLAAVKAITDRYFAMPKDFSDFLDSGRPGLIDFIWRDPSSKSAPR